MYVILRCSHGPRLGQNREVCGRRGGGPNARCPICAGLWRVWRRVYPPTVTRSHSHRKESTPSTHGHHLVSLTRHHAYRVDNSECDKRSQQRYPHRVKSQRPPEALIPGPRTPCRARGADVKLSPTGDRVQYAVRAGGSDSFGPRRATHEQGSGWSTCEDGWHVSHIDRYRPLAQPQHTLDMPQRRHKILQKFR